jgi:histidine triad (HIT) family protein
MEDCIFCKIAKGEVPSQKAHYEDDSVVSFLDINQGEPGHTLVIPAEHHRWFYEVPDELSEKLFRVAKHIAEELKREYRADYVRLSIVGVDVPHVHIHLIPKKFSEKVHPA